MMKHRVRRCKCGWKPKVYRDRCYGGYDVGCPICGTYTGHSETIDGAIAEWDGLQGQGEECVVDW